MTRPFISIIVCTYHRAECLGELLNSLACQDRRDFEVVVVDASDCIRDSARLAGRFEKATAGEVAVRVVPSTKGLPRQRNMGLANTRGDVVCFLDDDVTVEGTFVSGIYRAAEDPGMRDVGGFTGYDLLHYGVSTPMRYQVRRALGFYGRLRPGSIGICDATVPLSFQAPFTGAMDVGWLPGFCMIYRREAIAQLRFDEGLTAYGAEDAIFSMEIGRRWRLVMLGELRVRHHSTQASRISNAEAVYGASFALARNYLGRCDGVRSLAAIGWYAAVEFCLDAVSVLRRPTADQLRAAWARLTGIVDGARSVRSPHQLAESGGRG